MPIRVNGLASGLPPNLVDQVIEAERIPVKQMQEKKAKIEDKVKLVTDLETKVGDIGKSLAAVVGAKGFVDKKLNSSFPDIINGTLDPEDAYIAYQIAQGLGIPTPVQIQHGDTDDDGAITSTDVTYILRALSDK